MSFISSLTDGLRNMVAGLGTSRDKSSASEYVYSPLERNQIISAYRSNWLPRKIVNIPAHDATREWRCWNTGKEEISEIEETEKRFGIQAKVKKALVLARLLGGSALYYGVNGDSSISEELDLESIKADSLAYVIPLNMDQVSPTELENDPMNPNFGLPKSYTIMMSNTGRVENVHPSRLAVFHGEEIPDLQIFASTGWGDSVLQSIYHSLLQCDSTTAAIASLIFESKVDVINIPNLMKNFSDKGYEKKLIDRFTLAAMTKGNNGMMILDEKEVYTQKSQTFNALPDVMDRFAQNVSGAADIPMTRLFGRSPAGMNATGESDLTNYYDAVASIQKTDLSRAMFFLDEVLVRSSLGQKPNDLFMTWRPLWQPSAVQRATIFGQITSGLKSIKDAKILPDETFVNAAVNMLIETEMMPGLESAVEDFGLEKSEEELLQEAMLAGAAMGQPDPNDPNAKPKSKAPIQDSTPRSVYVYRQVKNAGQIIQWANSQGLKNIEPADELHVTVMHSRTEVDWMKIGDTYEDEITITGGPRIVEVFGDQCLVLSFSSRSLKWRHEDMRRMGCEFDYEEYQPHITIAKGPQLRALADIEPYLGKIILGPEFFEEVKAEGAK